MESDHTMPSKEQPAASEPQPLIPWGWLRALLFLIVATGAEIAGQLVMVTYFRPEGGFFANAMTYHMVLLQLVSASLTLAVMWIFARVIDRRPLLPFGFQLRHPFPAHLLQGIIWGAGANLLVFVILWVAGSLTVVNVEIVFGVFGFLFLSLLFAAAQEELLIRGYVLNNLLKSTRPWLALALSSLVFALFHLSNPNVSLIGLINIVLAGLFLGVYYMHRQNLWLPISLHFAWNFMQGPILGSPVSGINIPSWLTLEFSGSDVITGGAFGFEASIITSFVMIAGTVGIHLVYRKKRDRDKEAPASVQPIGPDS